MSDRATARQKFSRGDVVPLKRYCQWCYSAWDWKSGLIETYKKLHKSDCLYMRLRAAVEGE